jgi:hypothetical protein
MLKKILIGLSVLVVLLLASGFLLPSKWDVQRSIPIDASPSAIYASVATLKTWPDWTYWNRERDPAAEWSFEGPDTGAGAVMNWDGEVHKKGSLTIDTADPATGIEYTLSMEDMAPLKGSIVFAAEGSGTKVTWHKHGETNGMPWTNWMMLVRIDPIMGGQLEEGLENLKPLAEALALKGNPQEAKQGKPVEASADKDKK